MKILMVNKFLYQNGGSETYIFKIGDYLKSIGHDVEYFGMEHKDRIVGNSAEIYTSNIDFHSKKLHKLLYPFKIIYSIEAERKIRKVLNKFQPDVVHLNNFNFQLTPSIIYAIKEYERQSVRKVRIIYTAHDYQLLCPNHKMYNTLTRENCEKCLGGKFINCIKRKCIHESIMRSILGSIEGYLYNTLKTYNYLDAIISPSNFMAEKMHSNPIFKDKIIVLHNFVDKVECAAIEKGEYILYFGRYSEEKGFHTLIDACKSLPNIKFIFAGNGPLENELVEIDNIINVGFLSGESLKTLVKKARLSICPSVCYENCPFSVIESQMYMTPVLGADIGGIPELIEVGKTGELFKSGDVSDMKLKIESLWNDKSKLMNYSENCKNLKFDTVTEYCTKLLMIYSGNNKIN